MTTIRYLWDPAPTPSLPVRGTDRRMPVGRIFCVGRNYHAHATEMGAPVDKRTMRPFYFFKDAGSIVASGARIPYPPGTTNLHYEMELVVAIGRPGFRVCESEASSIILGYAAGLDLTRRDRQLEAREAAKPWDLAKNFENGAVCSEVVPSESVLTKGGIMLQVNGVTRQESDISMLIWSIPELVSDLSGFYHLRPGDLIYTGTPEGVGALSPGDRVTGRIEGLVEVSLDLEPEPAARNGQAN